MFKFQCDKDPSHVWNSSVSIVKNKLDAGKTPCVMCQRIPSQPRETLLSEYPPLGFLWAKNCNDSLSPETVGPDNPAYVHWHCFGCRNNYSRGIAEMTRAFTAWKESAILDDVDPDDPWSLASAASMQLCPACSRKSIMLSADVEVAALWHQTLNGSNIRPSNVPISATYKVTWKCVAAEDHVWEERVIDIMRRKRNLDARRQRKLKALEEAASDVGTEVADDVTTTAAAAEADTDTTTAATTEADAVSDDDAIAETTDGGKDDASGDTGATADSPGREANIRSLPVTGRRTLAQAKLEMQQKRQAKDTAIGTARALCPFCTGKDTVRSTSLAVKKPELAVLWHPTRNGPSTPFDINADAPWKVWFLCPRGTSDKPHQWSMNLSNRSPLPCPHCRNELLHMYSPDEDAIARSFEHCRTRIPFRCPKNPSHRWSDVATSLFRRHILHGNPCRACLREEVAKERSKTTAGSGKERKKGKSIEGVAEDSGLGKQASASGKQDEKHKTEYKGKRGERGLTKKAEKGSKDTKATGGRRGKKSAEIEEEAPEGKIDPEEKKPKRGREGNKETKTKKEEVSQETMDKEGERGTKVATKSKWKKSKVDEDDEV
eukprot:Rmarinus@m.14449